MELSNYKGTEYPETQEQEHILEQYKLYVESAEKVSDRRNNVNTFYLTLATSIAAAIRKELDIFIGNIIGSNIFNILAVLGITSVVKQINVNPMVLKFDMWWMIGISLLLFLFILPLRRATITRWKGFVFVAIYIIYIYLAFAL